VVSFMGACFGSDDRMLTRRRDRLGQVGVSLPSKQIAANNIAVYARRY